MSEQLQARLLEMFRYDAATGEFFWRVDRGPARKGARAGSDHPLGYSTLCVDGKNMYAHRMAWLYVHGVLPAEGLHIDHIDRDKKNNAIANLRVTTKSQNFQNRTYLGRRNSSGYLGVYWVTRTRRWEAKISLEGKDIFLGQFIEKKEAIAARVAAEQKHFTHAPLRNYGH